MRSCNYVTEVPVLKGIESVVLHLEGKASNPYTFTEYFPLYSGARSALVQITSNILSVSEMRKQRGDFEPK